MSDSINPGLVEVENQGFPPGPVPPVVSSPAASAAPQVDGGLKSPVSPNTINTTANTVIGQPASVQQFSTTTNVNV